MPKKKKGGKRKGKMTDEERAKKLEEERRNKEEMLAQFLKTKLAKEEKASKFNEKKLNEQWRNYMLVAKAKELKQELEIMHHSFERARDRKENLMKVLGKELQESEEQKAMAFRRHTQGVDCLIELLTKMMEFLHRMFIEEQEALIEEFDSERQMLIKFHEEEVSKLQDIMYAMDQNFLEKETELKTDFQTILDEMKNRNVEEKHALRIQLESVVEDLWNQFTMALKEYQEATEEKRQAYEALKARDERNSEEIEMQRRKIQRMGENISLMKYKLMTNSNDCEERNNRLKEERRMMVKHFQHLKAQLNKLRESERDRLTKVTMMADAAEQELNAKCTQSERILKFAEMCRGWEAEEEKVLPFYASTLSKEDADDIDDVIAEPSMEPLAEAMRSYISMENFWKRFNKALLDKVALDKERAVLVGQNHQLRLLLKQYLDGISVNDEILKKDNPLLIINHEVNAKVNVPLMERRVCRRTSAHRQSVVEPANASKCLDLKI